MARNGGFPYSALLAFIAIVAASFVVLQIAGVGLSQAGTDTRAAGNESVIVSYSNNVKVANASSRYWQGGLDNETVWNQSGAQLTEGVDYSWNTEPGTITFNNTSATTAGNTAVIRYWYRENTEQVQSSEPVMRTIAEAFASPFVYIPLATAFVAIAGLVVAWGKRSVSSGRRRGGMR